MNMNISDNLLEMKRIKTEDGEFIYKQYYYEHDNVISHEYSKRYDEGFELNNYGDIAAVTQYDKDTGKLNGQLWAIEGKTQKIRFYNPDTGLYDEEKIKYDENGNAYVEYINK